MDGMLMRKRRTRGNPVHLPLLSPHTNGQLSTQKITYLVCLVTGRT